MTYHVLVVEDEPLARMAILRVLKAEGYRTTGAANGVEAVQRQRSDPADIVVTDLRMPKMDGWALIQHLRGQTPAPAIVVVTASTLGEGADVGDPPVTVLNKPFLPTALIEAVRNALPVTEEHASA